MITQRPQTTTPPTISLPSVPLSLCSSPASHGLLLTTGATSKQTAHSGFEYYFFIMLACYISTHLNALKDFYLYCLKGIGPHVCLIFFFFPHSIFMTTYLDFYVFLLLFCFFYWFVQKWACSKLSDEPFEVGGGALDFALMKKLM